MKQTFRNAALAAFFAMAVTSPLVGRAQDLQADADQTINNFEAKDPTLQRFFDNSVGYAVFPTVAKGGMIIGGAHGDGLVYENGRVVGRATLTQGSIGVQTGGLTYSQIIFFQTPAALQDFKASKFAMSAEVKPVVAAEGAGAMAPYQQGVAVFTLPKGGWMTQITQATIGGQKFSFQPLE